MGIKWWVRNFAIWLENRTQTYVVTDDIYDAIADGKINIVKKWMDDNKHLRKRSVEIDFERVSILAFRKKVIGK